MSNSTAGILFVIFVVGIILSMAGGSQKKPKQTKGMRSDRTNGKAPKQNPKSNPEPTGKTSKGYTDSALQRRNHIRDLNFKGLTER